MEEHTVTDLIVSINVALTAIDQVKQAAEYLHDTTDLAEKELMNNVSARAQLALKLLGGDVVTDFIKDLDSRDTVQDSLFNRLRADLDPNSPTCISFLNVSV